MHDGVSTAKTSSRFILLKDALSLKLNGTSEQCEKRTVQKAEASCT
jgi:hypothetical protein